MDRLVMITEILIIILIIIVLLILLLFFKPWHIHVLFKNYNLDYDLSLKINFLLFQIIIEKILSKTTIKLYFNLHNYVKLITSINLDKKSSKKESKEESKDESKKKSKEKSDKPSNNTKEFFSKITEISKLLIDSKDELYKILNTIISIIKFKNSYLKLDIGLGDNNLTIKLCNLIWALTAPLYSLHFQIILKPEINQTIIKSNGDIYLSIKLVHLIKIVIILIKNRNLRIIIKKIVR